jgi:hypothetical protein
MNESMDIKGYVTVTVKRAKTGKEEVICDEKPNLLTTAGRDWIHGQLYASGVAEQAKYIALSSNTGGASAAHTSVAGEIVAGGLERGTGTVTHTATTNTTVISNVFTATTTILDVQLSGLLTAASVGTLVHENTFTVPVSLEDQDQLTVRWTITAG